MIQLDDELGQIDFVVEIHQLAEHALNPNLARELSNSTPQINNHISVILHSLYLSFITSNCE